MVATRRSAAAAAKAQAAPPASPSASDPEPSFDSSSLSPSPSPVVLFGVPILGLVYLLYKAADAEESARRPLVIHAVLATLSGLFTSRIVPPVAKYTQKCMSGKDINKRGTPWGERPVPEALGLAPALVFIVHCLVAMLFIQPSSQQLMATFCAVFATCFMVLLGFVDDALDIPWRYKLLLPGLASLPLLLAYPETGGITTIVVPLPLRGLVGTFVDLGVLYYVYMAMLVIFCTNSINILAGINGLEVAQSVCIGLAIMAHNLVQIATRGAVENHLFSFGITAPFVATSLGLLRHNWFPSRVFVGDTYTMFAGMSLASVAVLGHFSKTTLLFFIPQVLNFVLSIPQLFRLFGWTCPRHRLPRFDLKTGKLHYTPNLNLVNAALWLLGPMDERRLCVVLVGFQTLCTGLAFFVRYVLAGLFYEVTN